MKHYHENVAIRGRAFPFRGVAEIPAITVEITFRSAEEREEALSRYFHGRPRGDMEVKSISGSFACYRSHGEQARVTHD
jgi:hypothetical protein